MGDIKKKKRDFQPLPIQWQPDKVLDQLFNDEEGGSEATDELKKSLAQVAFSGSYNDLKDTPIKQDGTYDDTQIKAEVSTLKEKVEAINLSDYIKKSEIEEATSEEILAIYNG